MNDRKLPIKANSKTQNCKGCGQFFNSFDDVPYCTPCIEQMREEGILPNWQIRQSARSVEKEHYAKMLYVVNVWVKVWGCYIENRM